MKKLLLVLASLAAVTCQAQSVAFAKFAGDYFGPATPVHWACDERAIVNFWVYDDGSILASTDRYDFDAGFSHSGSGTVDAHGKFIVQMDNGHLIVGRVSSSGTVRGTLYGTACKATFAALRRFHTPSNP
jgi:hypothetical protein